MKEWRMVSGVWAPGSVVKSNKTCCVYTVRPQINFAPVTLLVEAHPSCVVEDVRIEGNSLFACTGGVPVGAFSPEILRGAALLNARNIWYDGNGGIVLPDEEITVHIGYPHDFASSPISAAIWGWRE